MRPTGWRVRTATFTGIRDARTGLVLTPAAKRYRGDAEIGVTAVGGQRAEDTATEAARELGRLQALPINHTRAGGTALFAPNGDLAGTLPSAHWFGHQRSVPRHPDPGDAYAPAINLTDLGENPGDTSGHEYVTVQVFAVLRHHLRRGRARQFANRRAHARGRGAAARATQH
jgi:hypothetical protein